MKLLLWGALIGALIGGLYGAAVGAVVGAPSTSMCAQYWSVGKMLFDVGQEPIVTWRPKGMTHEVALWGNLETGDWTRVAVTASRHACTIGQGKGLRLLLSE